MIIADAEHQWTSEQANRQVVDEPGGAVRDAVNLFTGRALVSFERFRRLLQLSPHPEH